MEIVVGEVHNNTNKTLEQVVIQEVITWFQEDELDMNIADFLIEDMVFSGKESNLVKWLKQQLDQLDWRSIRREVSENYRCHLFKEKDPES